MINLHCGYCCKNLSVIIVDDPELGIVEENFLKHIYVRGEDELTL